ncbi:MAG: DUF3343 domain-containing protein [Syntrophales bacterium]|jgi:hypothetical protein|nr:DUF3343 domain-containing protein [Syntrophales bacterium]MDD4340055.1 DUF3343 domain-containing protein [Syntrophales bacterium]HOG08302.1 DUF3343 domain-containing protein [Syntrophales bacterium]HOS77888.1 DUF3343 domain-containing protein [Syntrophales bacterium]
MTPEESYGVLLFQSVSYAIKAEKILLAAGLPHKLIPVPRHISSDCGVCLRFRSELRERILAALDGQVEIDAVHPLK